MAIEQVATIGYEGAGLADFIATLKMAQVSTLLDIRELAISRRPGFAKTALREALAGAGIGYRHEPALGSPRAIRHQLRDDGDYKKFFRNFEKHLRRHEELLATLVGELDGKVVLLCFERDHNLCHRRVVAQAFGEIVGVSAQHLGVQGHAQRQAIARARANSGEGVSTT